MTPPQAHRSGSTYDHDHDYVRLNKQSDDVWRVMHPGNWLSLRVIAERAGHPEASISARLRDFRKKRFGSHTVETIRMKQGLWLYRLVPNPDVKMAA